LSSVSGQSPRFAFRHADQSDSPREHQPLRPQAAGHAGRSLRTAPRFDFGLDMSHSKYESFQARLSFVVICWQSMHW
jgi:hypothetical protein